MSPKRRPINLLALAALVLLLTIYFAKRADGDDHMMHPPKDMLLHERFYSKWQRHGGGFCCNKRDCYPTKAVFDDALGLWKAERREDGKMLIIPKSVYDAENPQNERESPDGQSHLCAPPPPSAFEAQFKLYLPVDPIEQYLSKYLPLKPADTVYCFTPGEGH